jgi:phage terminase Nu1 subunit (DNA packaging protein)
MPVSERGSRGKPWRINTAEVSAWLEQRAKESVSGSDQADERELKRRKLAAETAKVELELARVRGEVVPLAQLERALANTFAEIKTNIRSVPSRVATAIIGESNETRIKAVILKEIDQALEVLGDFDLEPEFDDE